MWEHAVALLTGTLVSEDLASITAGLLIREGVIAAPLALAACFLGIYVGDLGIWLIGRLAGRRLLRARLVPARLGRQDLLQAGRWVAAHPRSAILGSRFVPGTRVPLYLAAGMFGARPGPFVVWTCISALIWVPLIVLGTAHVGGTVIAPFEAFLGGVATKVAGLIAMYVALRAGLGLAAPERRAALAIRWARFRRWEFWPTWAIYAPLVPCFAWLALRYGPRAFSAVNPGLPDSGLVGESKYEILERLASRHVLPAELIAPGEPASRIARLQAAMAERGWGFPVVLKPDVGQRGAGVRIVGDLQEAERYLSGFAPAVVAQQYHPGPYEAGVFYYRLPGAARGRIFSITDKRFPEVVGDGVSTLTALVWREPRLRAQAGVFLRRHAGRAEQVVPRGARMPLVRTGAHSQGTLFRDGGSLLTPALERALDDAARSLRGFYFGRFDIRYSDVEAFKSGRDLAIVELNGVSSESTNMYDPDRPLWWAYWTMVRQWGLAFRIGAANRRLGAPVTSYRRLYDLVRAHLLDAPGYPLAD